jgi:hypothetical protein
VTGGDALQASTAVPFDEMEKGEARRQIAVVIPATNGFKFPPALPHRLYDPTKKREPAKTKSELYAMLAEAIRNTQAENKRQPQSKKAKKA